MKGHLQKSLRVSAVIATMALGQLSAMAFDSADDVLATLQERIISQNFVTGPWSIQGTSVASFADSSQYDYNYGGAEITGTDVNDLVFKNFYLPGLNVNASITYGKRVNCWNQSSDGYMLNINISKVYAYGDKFVKIYPTYRDAEKEASYISDTDGGVLSDKINNRYYAYIRPGNATDTYSIYISSWDTYVDLRQDSSAKGLILAIYSDSECRNLVDAKTVIHGLVYYKYTANATASDYDENGKLIRTYKMYYSAQDQYGYNFYNLNCLGHSTVLEGGISDQTIAVTHNSHDKELYLKGAQVSNVVNNSTDFKFVGYGKLSSLLNTNNEVSAEDDGTANDEFDAYWFSYEEYNRTKLEDLSESANVFATNNSYTTGLETFGKYGPNEDSINHNHSTTACPWINDGNNGGDRTTGSQNVDFYFYDYGLAYTNNSNSAVEAYSTEKGSIKYLEKYSKTYITLDLGDNNSYDYTLDVSLSLDQFGSNKDNIYVSGTITPNKNTKYVDHYELCVKPGKVKTVSEFPAKDEPSAASEETTVNFATINFGEYGYPGALNVYGDTYDFPTISESSANVYSIKLAEASDDNSEESDDDILNEIAKDTYENTTPVTFSKLIPKQAGWYSQENGDATNYSFYVRAVYKDEYAVDDNENPRLDPTYSSIQVPAGVTTGIESVAEEANDATVVGAQGEINVFGDVDNAAVYSISGAQIYNGNAKVIAVPTGIYIVKAGNTVAKVAVP
jgi:hypothetical protein